ncbi:hypothetical protein F7725_006534 [Dissostichus mawsoni]|uniref:Uncharacterized protein n=1 Tax=Dissostichus mawsoni TaxID=36200 RepID=A0A7J5XU84_DISMA|nr:hypothetical protein F7725_006534 [Dissostichus mawsoni]
MTGLKWTWSFIFSQTLKDRLPRCLATSVSAPESSCGSDKFLQAARTEAVAAAQRHRISERRLINSRKCCYVIYSPADGVRMSFRGKLTLSLVFSHLCHRMIDQQQECSCVIYSPADGVRMSFRGKCIWYSVQDDDFVQKVTNTLPEAIYQGVPIFSLPLMFDQEGDLFRMRGESLIGSLNRDYFLEAVLQENFLSESVSVSVDVSHVFRVVEGHLPPVIVQLDSDPLEILLHSDSLTSTISVFSTAMLNTRFHILEAADICLLSHTGQIIRQREPAVAVFGSRMTGLKWTWSFIFSQTLKDRLPRCLATSVSAPESSCGSDTEILCDREEMCSWMLFISLLIVFPFCSSSSLRAASLDSSSSFRN